MYTSTYIAMLLEQDFKDYLVLHFNTTWVYNIASINTFTDYVVLEAINGYFSITGYQFVTTIIASSMTMGRPLISYVNITYFNNEIKLTSLLELLIEYTTNFKK